MQQRSRQRHGSRKAVDCENGVHPYEMQLARGGETAGKIKKGPTIQSCARRVQLDTIAKLASLRFLVGVLSHGSF